MADDDTLGRSSLWTTVDYLQGGQIAVPSWPDYSTGDSKMTDETPRMLADILADMRKQADNSDTETAHAYADDLLFELAEALATPENAGIVRQICDAYSEIKKWYA